MPRILVSLMFALVLAAVSLVAQTQTTVSYTLAVYLPTAADPNLSAPVSAVVYPATVVACGQAKVAASTTTVINPNEARIDDPLDATKDCVWTVSTQTNALVEGQYKAAVRANGSSASSLYGAFTPPFARVYGAPNAPANLRVRGS